MLDKLIKKPIFFLPLLCMVAVLGYLGLLRISFSISTIEAIPDYANGNTKATFFEAYGDMTNQPTEKKEKKELTTATKKTTIVDASYSEVMNTEMYKACMDIVKDQKKAASMAGLYYSLAKVAKENPNSGFNKYTVYGVMANSKFEGQLGVMEYANTYSRWKEIKEKYLPGKNHGWYDGSRIVSKAQVEEMLKLPDKTPNMGCGVGSIGWSYGRRKNYLKILLSQLQGEEVTMDALLATESKMIENELGPGGSHNKVLKEAAKNAEGKSDGEAAYAATHTLTVKYEAPANRFAQAVKRATWAKNNYNKFKPILEKDFG